MPRRITDEEVLMQRVIKMLPKGIPAEAIENVEYDPQDGGPDMESPSYWVYLKAGYICPMTECHTIHEDTLADLKMYVGSVKVWPDDPELPKEETCSLPAELFLAGDVCIFDCHDADSKLFIRDGSECTVVRGLSWEEVDIADVGNMYRIRFEDGFETDAFEDELALKEE